MAEQPADTMVRERHPVLEVFGVKLEVSNPHLAELLTMDAREALETDVRELVTEHHDPAEAFGPPAVDEAPPVDLVPIAIADTPPPAAPPPVPDAEQRRRREFRRAVLEAGVALGFDSGIDGLWRSPTGISVVTRSVDSPVSFAAAMRTVGEMAERRSSIAGEDSSGLFVVCDHQTADVLKVAVRQQRLHQVMRTIALTDLMDVVTMHVGGRVNHTQALVLLVPMAGIDVGEVLSLIRSAAPAR